MVGMMVRQKHPGDIAKWNSQLVKSLHSAAPGIEVSTGSLGHGLSIGAGMAEALKETRARVFVRMAR